MSDLRVHAYEAIRKKLREGRCLTPGDLSRRKLAAELNVSFGSVQWALVQLEAERLIETRPQSGTRVRRMSPAEIVHTFEFRIVVESYAAGRAARFITASQLRKLTRSCDSLERLHQRQARRPADQTEYRPRLWRIEHVFHGTILDAARNPVMAHVMENFRILAFPFVWDPQRQHGIVPEVTLGEHRQIVAALEQRNAGLARRLMRHHLQTGLERMKPLLRCRSKSEP